MINDYERLQSSGPILFKFFFCLYKLIDSPNFKWLSKKTSSDKFKYGLKWLKKSNKFI